MNTIRPRNPLKRFVFVLFDADTWGEACGNAVVSCVAIAGCAFFLVLLIGTCADGRCN